MLCPRCVQKFLFSRSSQASTSVFVQVQKQNWSSTPASMSASSAQNSHERPTYETHNEADKISEDVLTNHSKTTKVGEHDETKVKEENLKPKKSRLYLFNPSLSKKRLKTIEKVSSFVYTTTEIACVTMTRELTLHNAVHRKLTQKVNPTNLVTVMLPFMKEVGPVDLTLLEHISLPPRYHYVNNHHRLITMLLMGMLEKDLDARQVVRMSRSHTGDALGLLVPDTRNRRCSKKLVHEIVSKRRWRHLNIDIPYDVMFATDSVVNYTNLYESGSPPCAISPEMGDALIQAIAFWNYALNAAEKT